MDMIHLLVVLIIVVACVAIAGWFVKSSGVVIPQPVLIAIYAILAIVMILFLASFVGVGPIVIR